MGHAAYWDVDSGRAEFRASSNEVLVRRVYELDKHTNLPDVNKFEEVLARLTKFEGTTESGYQNARGTFSPLFTCVRFTGVGYAEHSK